MLKRRRLGLAALFIGTFLSASDAQSIRVPGTSVGLTPPAGFGIAQQHPGSEQPDERASIMVTEEARSGRPMNLYQVIIPDDTGYYILQGLSTADRAAELLPECRAMTGSFRLVQKGQPGA